MASNCQNQKQPNSDRLQTSCLFTPCLIAILVVTDIRLCLTELVFPDFYDSDWKSYNLFQVSQFTVVFPKGSYLYVSGELHWVKTYKVAVCVDQKWSNIGTFLWFKSRIFWYIEDLKSKTKSNKLKVSRKQHARLCFFIKKFTPQQILISLPDPEVLLSRIIPINGLIATISLHASLWITSPNVQSSVLQIDKLRGKRLNNKFI